MAEDVGPAPAETEPLPQVSASTEPASSDQQAEFHDAMTWNEYVQDGRFLAHEAGERVYVAPPEPEPPLTPDDERFQHLADLNALSTELQSQRAQFATLKVLYWLARTGIPGVTNEHPNTLLEAIGKRRKVIDALAAMYAELGTDGVIHEGPKLERVDA